MSRLIILLILCFISTVFSADAVKVEIKDQEKVTNISSNSKERLRVYLQLSSLELVRSSENVDELYIAVTTYPSSGKARHRQLPAFPRYWLSTHLKQIKNLNLWRGLLKEGQSITIHLSLVERDTPPFDNDDLVYTVLLKMKNIKGKLETKWSMPNSSKTGTDVKIDNGVMARLFDLKSEDAHYKAKFIYTADLIGKQQ